MKKGENKTHGVKLLLRAVVRDPEGKVIQDTGERPSRSFLIQFLEFVYGLFDGIQTDATQITGAEAVIYTTTPTYPGDKQFDLTAAINDDTHGIKIGTGTTAETNTDYVLETPIAEGSGSGQMTHGAMDSEVTAVVGANVDLIFKRAFTNNSGATITVGEAGIYVKFWYATPWYHCILRDALAATIDIPDKCSLTVYYTFRTTV